MRLALCYQLSLNKWDRLIQNRVHTHIYQSRSYENWYLVLPANREDDFSQVPAQTQAELGELVKIQSAEVGPGSLGIDLLQAKTDFNVLGYHIAKTMAE
ncbi:hypothetical protein GCM10027299_03230 [Larkinella ripae]